jgi:hypothetical protein
VLSLSSTGQLTRSSARWATRYAAVVTTRIARFARTRPAVEWVTCRRSSKSGRLVGRKVTTCGETPWQLQVVAQQWAAGCCPIVAPAARTDRRIRGDLSARTARMRHFVGRSATMRQFVGSEEAVSWSLQGQFVVLRQQRRRAFLRVAGPVAISHNVYYVKLRNRVSGGSSTLVLLLSYVAALARSVSSSCVRLRSALSVPCCQLLWQKSCKHRGCRRA